MAIRVEEYVLKGNEFINHVARQLNDPENTGYAGRVTVSVLHALRDLLPPEESLHLIAQLPLYIKAAYVDGWKINRENIGSSQNFLEKIRAYESNKAEQDLIQDEDAKKNFHAVLTVLKKFVSKSEIQHVADQLPPELNETQHTSNDQTP